MAKPVSYDEVVKMLKTNSGCLLDVRTQEELDTHGRYPKYIHVPHSEVAEAMQLPDSEFKARYHGDKPKAGDQIITSCMAGKRAGMAADALAKLNFTNVGVYSGSFSDWKSQQADPAKAYKD
ncbi:hypothetical protein BOX15_Mlig032871g1 [Macrostomum lignano]|uniref:Rhodanese domain-containing protein n=1 Tax=Macrostomum lignano TaxID=282301 RepID=A0A267FDH2_9PLAT|nr:hypothetical protein BOX15_Mlig024498g1 [Macrostomum lignano]PAA71808.1 hypothetical protein BOX15_Mlig032871g1 [Macrostomum lignano]